MVVTLRAVMWISTQPPSWTSTWPSLSRTLCTISSCWRFIRSATIALWHTSHFRLRYSCRHTSDVQVLREFNPLTPTDCHVGTAIKHPVPGRVKPSFVIFWHPGTLTPRVNFITALHSYYIGCSRLHNYVGLSSCYWIKISYQCNRTVSEWVSSV